MSLSWTSVNDWTKELVESILWRQNRHFGAPEWEATKVYDLPTEWWLVRFREKGSALPPIELVIPDEYTRGPGFSRGHVLFDELVDAIRDRWQTGGRLDLRAFISTPSDPSGWAARRQLEEEQEAFEIMRRALERVAAMPAGFSAKACDHDYLCCRTHKTHSMPHRGCVLR